jgi:hypothetical protein
MAIKTAVRFTPDSHQTTQQTAVESFDPTLTHGTVVMAVQLVAYDDAAPGVTWANYIPGDPAYEKWITVLYQDVLRGDLSAAASATDAAILTYWSNALNAWAATLAPSVPALLRAIRGARRAAPVVLG